MCRGKRFCVELGSDPLRWSRTVPLPLPDWFDAQLDTFVEAARYVASGDRASGVSVLQSIRSNDLRCWLCEHGQMSGIHRRRTLGVPAPPYSGDTDKNNLRAIEDRVFTRDGYRCRYCGTRVVAKSALAALERAVGKPEFCCSTNINAEDHGIVLVFKAVADHVAPLKLGGRTDLDNLVTGCQPCNYGKYNFTLDQLGLDDPRERPPVTDDWDGLTSLVPGLKANPGGR